MANLSDDLSKKGYSREEEYFEKINRELIEKRRSELDSKKPTKQAHAQEPWWMTCPKCGTKLQEINLRGILIDRCSGCRGVFLDDGELDTLSQTQQTEGFMRALRKVF